MADSDTTARGLLTLRPIPTFFMEDTLDTPDLDTPDTSDTMASDTDSDTADSSTANRLHQDISVN